jgi:hypothetical protein
MASDSGDGDGPVGGGGDQAEASHEPRECMACRGTGQVISNLGGTTSRVTCPWCGGGGLRLTGVDAQARWAQAPGGEDAVDAPSDSVD